MQDKSVVPSTKLSSSSLPKASQLTPSALEAMHTPLLRNTLTTILKQLHLEQRFILTKIYVHQLADTMKSVVEKGVGVIGQGENREDSVGDKGDKGVLGGSSKGEGGGRQNGKGKMLFEWLVLVSDGQEYLDHLCFEYGLLQNPQKMVDLLTSNLTDPKSQPVLQALSHSPSPSFRQTLSKCHSKFDLDDLLTTFIRNELLLRLHKGILEGQLVKLLEEERRVKKQFNNFWRYLPEEHKRRVLLLGKFRITAECKDTEGLAYHLSKKRIELSGQQLEQEIRLLLKLTKNQFNNRIFKCKFKNVGLALTQYHKMVYLGWKREVQNYRRKRVPKPCREERQHYSQHKNQSRFGEVENRRKKGKLRKSISLESNQTNETEGQMGIKTPEKKMGQNDKQLEVKPEGYHVGDRFEQKRKQCREFICSVEKEERSIRSGKNKHYRWQHHTKMTQHQHQHQKNPQLSVEEQDELLKQYSISSKTTFSSEASLKPSKNPLYSPEVVRSANLSKLADELSEMSDNISQQANQYYQRRIVAFERIQFLLQYYSVPIKLFGSCANGIAVKNSDIDIAIDQSILNWIEPIPETERVRVALERVEQMFMPHPCIKQIKLIKTATVPVLKLTIDTSVPFISTDFYQLNRPHNSGPIQADITVQTSTNDNQSSHLGVRTTAAIGQWINSLKPLHSIVIIMKQFFTVNKLNLAYEGGLNTISMIVMLVAYITHAQLEEEENTAVVLEKILRFYVYEFNQKATGIDLLQLNNRPIFYKKEQYEQDDPKLMKADLEIRDPICQGKNMTRNCYQYSRIKDMFSVMLGRCFERGNSELEEMLKKEEKGQLSEMVAVWFGKRNVFVDLHREMQSNF